MRRYLASLIALELLVSALSLASPAHAAQSFVCQGRMDNGFGYLAHYVDGRFTEIVWDRPGQPPTTTSLNFKSTDNQGQPVYQGSFLAATTVTLIDRSRGNVGPGTEILIEAEEWGSSSAACGLGVADGGEPPPPVGGLTCTGQMNNGFGYMVHHQHNRFTSIVWERPGQPPTTTTLTFDNNNEQGQPIYRGSFLAATAVTMVDLSGGNPGPGSQVSIGVEEWGWSRGICQR